jgi:hypothetical protein
VGWKLLEIERLFVLIKILIAYHNNFSSHIQTPLIINHHQGNCYRCAAVKAPHNKYLFSSQA